MDGYDKRHYCKVDSGQYYTNIRANGILWGSADNISWHQLVLDVNNNYDWFTYLDTASGASKNNFGDYTIGVPLDIAANHGTGCWVGWIDEFRLSNKQRSAAWRDTSYNTINDSSNFFNVGPEETAP